MCGIFSKFFRDYLELELMELLLVSESASNSVITVELATAAIRVVGLMSEIEGLAKEESQPAAPDGPTADAGNCYSNYVVITLPYSGPLIALIAPKF